MVSNVQVDIDNKPL